MKSDSVKMSIWQMTSRKRTETFCSWRWIERTVRGCHKRTRKSLLTLESAQTLHRLPPESESTAEEPLNDDAENVDSTNESEQLRVVDDEKRDVSNEYVDEGSPTQVDATTQEPRNSEASNNAYESE